VSVSRRAVLAAGTGAALALSLPGRVAAATARPNILWLVSEDNQPFVGAYGDPVARTPTINRLASQGIRYDNAFATAPVCAPSRFAIITGMYAESSGPAHHMRASGKIPSFAHGFPEYLRSAGYYCVNNDKTDYNAPINLSRTWNESGPAAHWRKRPAGAPFFAVFNYMTTHESSHFGAGPGATRAADVRVPAYQPDLPAIRQDRARYYDLMAKLDQQLAIRLDELDDDGLAENTIVFYYSDHGGVLPRSKRFCYDSGLRVPLIARFPARWAHLAPAAAGSVVTAPVSLIDLAPSVLSLAGVNVPDHMHGSAFAGSAVAAPSTYAFSMRSRMDERYDMVRTVRNNRYRYIRNYAPHRPWGTHQAYAWQQRGYQVWEQAHLDGKLNPVQERFWHDKPAEELYDLQTDPDEVNNLIDNPAHRTGLGELRAALDRHMLAVNDNGFIPEGAPTDGYDASRKPGAYPLSAVMALAALAIQRDPANLQTFITNVTASNPVLRYWAASGCLMLGGRAAAAATALEKRMDTDAWPQVRIVAAEALARIGRTGRSIPYLATVVDTHDNPRVRLQALNSLTFVGEAARPALPSIRTAASSTDTFLRSAGRYLRFTLEGTYTPTSPIYVD
jgi:arylsulfatase A-like enzyme